MRCNGLAQIYTGKTSFGPLMNFRAGLFQLIHNKAEQLMVRFVYDRNNNCCHFCNSSTILLPNYAATYNDGMWDILSHQLIIQRQMLLFYNWR
jgi:hypothetical protein